MRKRSGVPANESAGNNHTYSDTVSASMVQYDSATVRAREYFSEFQNWTAANPHLIAQQFELYEQHILELQKEATFTRRVARLLTSQPINSGEVQEYADYFGVTNLGQLPSEDLIVAAQAWRKTVGSNQKKATTFSSPEDAFRQLASYVPGVISEDQIRWSGDRLHKLYHLLPEFVIQNNGMEKVIRTMMGVVAVAAAESYDLSAKERNDRIARSVHPAYLFAATYPIVDDVLHDSDYIKRDEEKTWFHNAILRGLSTGQEIDGSKIPDHPLAEEMLSIYNEMREILPFDENRDLYYALESMYLAQHYDATRAVSQIASEADLYAPIMLKSAMSRMVIHKIIGNEISPERSSRLHRTLLRQQLADDQRDAVEDFNENRITPFTLQVLHPELGFKNPLFYRIAQEAYISNHVYGHEDPDRISRAFSAVTAGDMAYAFAANPSYAAFMSEHFGDQEGQVDQLMRVATGIGRRAITSYTLLTPDKRIAKLINESISERNPQSVDLRTYISDALPYINEVLFEEVKDKTPLNEVARYVLEGGGKRVRPALTMMLAESLGVPRKSIEPLLISAEFAHSASLIFDDLPAQDNASMRRGREAAHIKFPEFAAQLTGILLMDYGRGVLGRLGKDFPASRVNEVVEYVGTELSPRLCQGQYNDLVAEVSTSSEEIVEIYNLKTSTMIEGSLVPLMMLVGRSEKEISMMKRFAYHAGIVFQLRDDILDATSSAEIIGKDAQHDGGKRNIVTTEGVEGAQSMLNNHLQDAINSLSSLPFPTDLIRELTVYFATRKK